MIKKLKELFFGKAPLIGYEREYVVIDCDRMPSAIGMTTQGVPTLKGSFIIKKGSEYRTIYPIEITKKEKGFEVKTNKITLIFYEKEA